MKFNIISTNILAMHKTVLLRSDSVLKEPICSVLDLLHISSDGTLGFENSPKAYIFK